MDTLHQPNHRDAILRALTQVPIATTKQIATLNSSLHPQKKASAVLRDLEQERIVESQYHQREKIWRLTKKGRTIYGTSATRLSNISHALAVINLYFHLKPRYWMYEPKEKFEHLGQRYTWRPDCIFVHNTKLYACEVQRSLPPGRAPWARKWFIYGLYFNHGYYKTACFQKWAKSTIAPNFLCITRQNPETVKNGFEIRGRELIVVKDMK